MQLKSLISICKLEFGWRNVNSISVNIAAVLVVLSCSLYLFGTLGRTIKHSEKVAVLAKLNPSSNITFVVYGWPIVKREEIAVYYRQHLTGASSSEHIYTERCSLIYAAARLVFTSNISWWFLITFMTALSVSSLHWSGRKLQLRLYELVFAITCVSVFLTLSKDCLDVLSYFLLIPISFGICCCIFESLRLMFVFGKAITEGIQGQNNQEKGGRSQKRN